MGISVVSNPLFTDSHHYDQHVALIQYILPSSGPMKALSGVLESSRAALSIRRIFCRIKANSENHLGK